MPSSALAICAREKTACESAQTRPGDFGRLVWGGGAGSGGVRFGLSVAGGILAAPPVGRFGLSIPVADMGLRRQKAMVGVVGMSFLTSTSHQVQSAVGDHGATNGYGRFANWVCTGTILFLWEKCGCLRWEVGRPRKSPRPINDPSIQAMICHKNELHIYPPGHD